MTDQFGAKPDERAIRTLFATYWSPQGWVDDPSTPPEELSHAVEAGVMFEPATTEATHDEVVEAVIAARDRVEEDQVRAAFLHSLTSRRLELRSALGSFAVARHLALHPHDPDASRYCTVCGRLPDAAAIDRNVMSFERLKWGGVRHDQLEYVAFDLERFALATTRRRPQKTGRCMDACSTSSTSSTSCPPARPRRRPPRAACAS